MPKKNNWKTVFLVSLGVGGVLSLFASASPDGMEKVAEDKGFLVETTSAFAGIIPDYVMPGIAHESLATALAGVIGTVIVFALLFVFGRRLFTFGAGSERSEKI